MKRFKDRVRELWDARQSKTNKQMRDQWEQWLRGWVDYYRIGESRPVARLESWIRRRIRCYDWQRWHKAKGRCAKLRKLGVNPEQAKAGRSSRGAWRTAKHRPCKQRSPTPHYAKHESSCQPNCGPGKTAPMQSPDADPHVRWCGSSDGRHPVRAPRSLSSNQARKGQESIRDSSEHSVCSFMTLSASRVRWNVMAERRPHRSSRAVRGARGSPGHRGGRRAGGFRRRCRASGR